jgi:hypothetical protein
LTLHKRGSFLHREKRDEKERQVVVRSFEPGLIQAAGTAHSRLVVQGNGFGLDARNKEAHDATSDENPLKRCERGGLEARRNITENL